MYRIKESGIIKIKEGLKMITIYKPKGKAREYSPYALNIYKGCDHDCKYCYVNKMTYYKNDNENPVPRENIIPELEKYLKKNRINKQVLLCFTGDPYCKKDIEYNKTREALKILNYYNVPVAILTKGGERILRDVDIFKKFNNIKIGATLTLINKKQSMYYEPRAALPEDRIETLYKIHNEGIRTWVSFEPVIDPLQTIKILDMTNNFIDEYQVGKMNYYNIGENINWGRFGDIMAKKLLYIGKDFYIKKDLYKYMSISLENKYINQDNLALENQETYNEVSQDVLF